MDQLFGSRHPLAIFDWMLFTACSDTFAHLEGQAEHQKLWENSAKNMG
jgi:hypothetical protein